VATTLSGALLNKSKRTRPDGLLSALRLNRDGRQAQMDWADFKIIGQGKTLRSDFIDQSSKTTNEFITILIVKKIFAAIFLWP
jgi:hypothetical protein